MGVGLSNKKPGSSLVWSFSRASLGRNDEEPAGDRKVGLGEERGGLQQSLICNLLCATHSQTKVRCQVYQKNGKTAKIVSADKKWNGIKL